MIARFSHFEGIRHFQPSEFKRPECLRKEMITKLDRLREACGFALIVTSSFRDADHNRAVGGVDGSAHCLSPDGFYSGIDLSIANLGAAGLFRVVRNALMLGFNRIGVYGDHVHLDVEDRLPQQVLWVGKD